MLQTGTLPPTAHATKQTTSWTAFLFYSQRWQLQLHFKTRWTNRDNNAGPSLFTHLQPRGTGKTEGNHGWPSGLRCTAPDLQRPQHKRLVQLLLSPVGKRGWRRTKDGAPVLPEDAVGAGHDHAFVGHHADDLHHPGQLLFKLGDKPEQIITL